MSLSAALQSALSGLGANARMLETTSGNLANQLTPGYAARSVTLGAPAGLSGGGVRVVSVDRSTDPALTAMRRTADAAVAGEDALAAAAGRLSTALGETGESGSLLARHADFVGALGALADTPEAAPRQHAAAVAAVDLAAGLRAVADETRSVRQDADAAIARQVDAANGALREVARLNRQIQIAAATGAETGALADARERAIDRVAAIVPLREIPRDDGRIELRTAGGLTLLDHTAREIRFTPTPVITPEMAYSNGTGALSGITLDGIDITPGGPGSQAVEDGALAGLFSVRDEMTVTFQARVDALAADLVVRGIAGDPTLAPGDPGLFTDSGAGVDPASIEGLAGRIIVNAGIDPDGAGETWRLRDGLGAATEGAVGNDAILRDRLAALRAASHASDVPGLSGSTDLAGRLVGVMELTATRRTVAESALTAQSAVRETLAGEEGRARAVDPDSELQGMVLIEQAYAANAQVIQTAARMLDQLMEL